MTCDKCGKTYDDVEDILEVQEFLKIDFVGGFGSVFGDGTRVMANICQHCLKKMMTIDVPIKYWTKEMW